MQRLQQLRFSSMRDAIGGIQEERTKDAASAILSSVVCVSDSEGTGCWCNVACTAVCGGF